MSLPTGMAQRKRLAGEYKVEGSHPFSE